jgi:hypothetical protein
VKPTVFEEVAMISNAFCIIRETTEDRFDETESLEEAVRIARSLAREGQAEPRFPSSIGAKSSGNWSLCSMARWKKRRLSD